MLIRVCHKAEISWCPAKLHLFKKHVYWKKKTNKQQHKNNYDRNTSSAGREVSLSSLLFPFIYLSNHDCVSLLQVSADIF